MPKFEVCAVMAAYPEIIEADNIEQAVEIANEMMFDEFDWMAIEVTDVEEVDGE